MANKDETSELNYIAVYTRKYRNHMDMPQAVDEILYLGVKKSEDLEKKIITTFEGIVNDPKSTNTAVQVHGVYEIAKEIKLKNYNFANARFKDTFFQKE